MSTFRSVLAAMAVSAFGLVGAVSQPVMAGTSCKADLKIKNSHSSNLAIKITKVEYQVAPNGSWHSEGLSDKVLTNGAEHVWKGQNLGDAAEGTKLNFRVFFKLDDGKGFGAEQSQKFDKSDKTCTDGKEYSLIVK